MSKVEVLLNYHLIYGENGAVTFREGYEELVNDLQTMINGDDSKLFEDGVDSNVLKKLRTKT